MGRTYKMHKRKRKMNRHFVSRKSKRRLGRSRRRGEELGQSVCSNWDACQFSVSIQDEEFL